MDDWQKQWWKQIEKTTAEVEQFWDGVEEATESFIDELGDNLGLFLEELHLDFVDEVDKFVRDFIEIIADTSSDIDSAFGDNFQNFTDEDFTSVTYHTPSELKNPACINCANYHGQSYNGNLLVCAIHPSGWEDDNCPDWSEEI